MSEAVHSAKESSVKGDIILLSPAAASFGLFQNEFDRGEKFKKAVKGLK
jgi:UDP-N-acetylmuramoylalanine--D-glutamate ligase